MKLNKKLLILLLIGFTLSTTANAQFGKLKIKKPKISKKIAKKKPNNKTTATRAKASGDSKTIKIENEGAERLEILKALFADRATTSAKTPDELKTALQLFQNKYSTLKNYYADTSTRLPEFKEAYTTYKELVGKEVKMREQMESVAYSLKMNSESVDRLKADFRPGMFLNSTSNLVYYKEYKEAKDAFENSGYINEELTSYITNLEDYFDNFVTGIAAHKLTEYFTTYRAFNESDWKVEPKSAIALIERSLKEMDELVYTRVKDAKWVDALKKKMLDQKAKLQDYIDSGAYDKFLAEERSKMVEKVRMYKPQRTDASVVSVVKSKHTTSEYGTLKKIVITSEWYVEKNGLGIPIDKRTRLQVAVIKDDVCTLYEGMVYKQYQGGGTYGPSKLSRYHSRQEIKCSNINK